MASTQQTVPGPRQTLPPSEIDCKWWKKGYCFRGTTCYFRHDEALAGIDKPDGAGSGKRGLRNHASSECNLTMRVWYIIEIENTIVMIIIEIQCQQAPQTTRRRLFPN
jgi:hypothetical protein